MKTVEQYVISSLPSNPKILFITENCPDLGYYLYRTLNGNPHPIAKGANNLLNNLCKATNIVAGTETEKLAVFLNQRKYALIDTYKNGTTWIKSTKNVVGTSSHSIIEICEDIVQLNPEQIVFTCKRSNSALINDIIFELPAALKGRIVQHAKGKIFNSPSNRAYKGFLNEITGAINSKNLVL